MNTKLKLLRTICVETIEKIDSNKCDWDDEEIDELTDTYIENCNPDKYVTKVQAREILKMSQTTFDIFVRTGELPKGIKRVGFNNLVWKKSVIKKFLRERRKNHSE